ncbi:acyltransferase family protein [Roseobacter denitrificans]|uniref:acyltransferase family protein n=1 Tax=Roseobacter denitrificans TaxID=2434 RepID=UPI0015598BA2|nr:acyltransferase [Roseobacter denitrificans]
MDWIDIAKGIGIILVVLGHAGRGLSSAGLPDADEFLKLLDEAIYAFHMPMFFLLSGVTFGMRPPATVHPSLTLRTWRLFYALVIWTYAFLALRALAGDDANTPGAWGDLAQAPLPPFAHFWFLWALLVNTVVFAVLRLALRPVLHDLSFWLSALALAIALNFIITLPQQLTPWFAPALDYSLIFAVGGLIGASSLIRATPNLAVAMLGSTFFVAGLWLCVSFDLPISRIISGLGLTLCLILPLMTLSTYYGKSGWAQAIAFLGMISLAIYVMHTMFSAGLRILLLNAGIHDLSVHLILGLAIGILGPLLAYLAARRLKLLHIAGLA